MNIELVDTLELTDELHRRFPLGGVIAMTRVDEKDVDGFEIHECCWGNGFAQRGLSEYLNERARRLTKQNVSAMANDETDDK